MHLRTDALPRPWQSYRQIFRAYAEWRTTRLPSTNFFPIARMFALDTRRLRRSAWWL